MASVAICVLASLFFAGSSVFATPSNLPVVLWHGMGASDNTGGTNELKKLIEDKLGRFSPQGVVLLGCF